MSDIYNDISEAKLDKTKQDITDARSKLNGDNRYSDETMGRMLSAIGTLYFSQLDLFSDFIAYETEVSVGRQISETMTGYKPQVASLFGVPVAITEGSVYVDVDTDTYGVAPSSEENESGIFNFMFINGLAGSYLEGSILEQTINTPSVSTVKILELAKRNGINIVTLSPYTMEGLDELEIDSVAKSEIRTALENGKTVIVPEKDICYYDRKGI